jgi:cytochrome c
MKTFKMLQYVLLIILLSISITGCSKKENPIPKQEVKKEQSTSDVTSPELSNKGKEIFYMESKTTGLKCADCHNDGTNPNDIHFKYFADIFNANKRPSTYFGMYKGEDVPKTAGGADLCWTRFLKMETPLDADKIKALNSYFETTGKGKELKEFNYTTIALPKPDKLKLKDDQIKIAALTGDVGNGEKMFNETCTYCHSDKSNVKHVPDLFKKFGGNLKSITFHIRMGSKHMPFYPYEFINDQNIADISAFILKKNNINP